MQVPRTGVANAARLASTSLSAGPARIGPRDLRKSWISPDIKRTPRLLFVSDNSTYDVYIFSLPDFTLKGTLTGFSEPQGMCSDRNGDIWLANTGLVQVLEYSRSGTLLNTIEDNYGYPVSCAIDPKTGDIAVVDIYAFLRGSAVKRASGSGYENVLIYGCPSCTPKLIDLPEFELTYFAGYDPDGDLFVDGRSYSNAVVLAEVPSGSDAGHLISISGATIYYPGMVEWYKTGNELAVGDQECGGQRASCVYSIAISGSSGTVTGRTTLTNPAGEPVCDMVQGALNPAFQKNLVGGDYDYCGYSPTSEDRWLYPAGSAPTNYTTNYISGPLGAAVSTK
jgi:hypothetical protein